MLGILIAIGAGLILAGCSGDDDSQDVDPFDSGDTKGGDTIFDGFNTSTYECGDGYCCIGSGCCSSPSAAKWFCRDAGSTDTGNTDIVVGDSGPEIPDVVQAEIPDIVEPPPTDIVEADIEIYDEDADTDTPLDSEDDVEMLNDDDSDGIPNKIDNCPTNYNPNQIDSDTDNVGNECDNCIDDYNPEQVDTDEDLVGNECDNCPDVINQNQTDTDEDGYGNDCEECPTDPEKLDPGTCGCNVSDVDTDYDGTPNCIDDCPDDPNLTTPGPCGCDPIDSDFDMTPDCIDDCDADPNKVDPGVCGCGTPDIDTDNDAFLDCEEECINDPDKTSPGICGCGEPDIDTDQDSVLDCLDGCPTDPNLTSPGPCGCNPLDTDNDTVPDCLDGCHEDPNKIEPGVCGCGTPDTDSDEDGTPNCNDACPEDSGKVQPGVCGCDVPDDDVDIDGVIGCNDNCPNDHNPSQKDIDSNGIGDACDPNVKEVYSGVNAADIDAFDIGADSDDEIIIYGQNPSGSPILLECTVMGANLFCGAAIPFPNDGLLPVAYLPQSYGGLAIATDPVDGTPNGIRRFDREPDQLVQDYSFEVVDIGTAEFEPTYPTGIAASGAKLLISEANCIPSPLDPCDKPGLILGFNNSTSWDGIGSQLSPFAPVIDSRKLTALTTTQIPHSICEGDLCNLLAAMSAGSGGNDSGISLHNTLEVEMLSREWIPLSGPVGNTEAYPLSELNIVQGGFWAIVPMRLPEKGIKAINLSTHTQNETLFSNCIEDGTHITDVAIDTNAETSPGQPSFNVYLIAGGRIVFLNITKSTMSGEILGYYQMPVPGSKASVAGARIYVGSTDNRIISILPDSNLLLEACN
ncbi:MAG: hypothetical protein HN337_08945 [Deltaproteobacteria bacterium]|jgi:hypothetical protein|nr:hypothetical protein [Deltaproteobacteria bacterium]